MGVFGSGGSSMAWAMSSLQGSVGVSFLLLLLRVAASLSGLREDISFVSLSHVLTGGSVSFWDASLPHWGC